MKNPSTHRMTVAALSSIAVIGLASVAQAQMEPSATAQRRAAAPAKRKPASPISSPMAAQAAIPSPAPETAKAESGADAIARVGNVNISADDVRAYLAGLGPREQAMLAKDPSLLSQAVRQMLAAQVVLQEVHAQKWDKQADVTAKLEKMRDNALVELYLESVSTPPQNFPSEDDLQKVYDANRAAFLMPRQFELVQIFIASPKSADKAAEEQARKSLDDALRKIKAPGADFSAVATETGSPNGGAVGWVAESQIVPEIRSQVEGLAKGTVSEPVRLDDGWHVVKLIDTKASYTRTLPEVRDQLIQQIRAERSKTLRQAYVAELLKKSPPAINELALSKILANPSR